MRISKPRPPSATFTGREEMYLTILKAWEGGLFTQTEAAAALNIDQSQVSRIIQGRFRKPTGHAEALFAYAKIKLEGHSVRDGKISAETSALRKMLVGKLLATWDNTPAGAEALVSLLDAVRQLRQTGCPADS